MWRYWLVLCGIGSVSSGTGLVKGSYACIYRKKMEIWSEVSIAGRTDERTNKERCGGWGGWGGWPGGSIHHHSWNESSGFRKYSTLLVIQLFSRRLCLFLCLCIRLCLCICVPYSFLNSYYHKLSENVWVWGSVASRSGDVTIAGRTDEQKGKIELLSH